MVDLPDGVSFALVRDILLVDKKGLWSWVRGGMVKGELITPDMSIVCLGLPRALDNSKKHLPMVIKGVG
jgi:hypothetical protein